MSLFEQIKAICTEFQDLEKFKEQTTVTVYQHRQNKDDKITDLEDAITRGLNLAEYEKVTNTTYRYQDFKQLFYGDKEYKVSKEDTEIISHLQTLVNSSKRKPRTKKAE